LGRDVPYIADMLTALAARNELVLGIINCDLLFQPDGFWGDLPKIIARKTAITGQRYDVMRLNGVMNPYFPGFDFFFFDREAAKALADEPRPFAMGVPWWDYWFPLSLMLRGYDVQCLTRPVVLHLQHDQQIEARTPRWRRLAREFARAMLHDSRSGHLPTPHGKSLVGLCRVVDQADEVQYEAGAFDQQIIELSAHAVPLIAGKMVELAKGSPVPYPAAIPEGSFEHIPARVAAGTALVRGLWDDKHGNMQRAEWQFERAVEAAPWDASVLFECGNFFYRQGKMARAAELLSRAVEHSPQSPILLNSLGSTLGHLSRNEEAADCFARAIAADPLYGASYYNLAIVLWLKKKHGDVIRHLEERIAQTPDFPDGAEWLKRIRETVSAFEGEVAERQANR
jgi:hypothetical protein